ncbi:MAG: polyribonucleotide nucleotidyltransferase [Deltaproteobacteria bacterium]|nr:polyribonucleotide nucleotidyltransferase [Deltaproteobacteria bacterium]
MQVTLEAQVGGKTLSIQTGKIARQANGSVVVTYGETMVLVTAVASNEDRPGDFFPLTVEYQEKVYAAGRIPGNYFRREVGRPSEKETLTARQVDRPIRPLFPKGYMQEVQVIATVLSMDQENDPDTLALVGASAALCISDIPFNGPVASVRVGRIDGQLIINPTLAQIPECDLNITVAGSKDGIVMVEGGGKFLSEAEVTDAVYFGQEAIQAIIGIQLDLIKTVGVAKRQFNPPAKDEELWNKVKEMAAGRLRAACDIPDKLVRADTIRALGKEVMASLGEDYASRGKEVSEIMHDLLREVVRNMVLNDGLRIAGRGMEEVRAITAEVGVLPRTHGSALFTRGETQALGVLTLGSAGDEQRVETLSGDESRPFMLHYNFPPYSVREVKRLGGPSRRELGHGGLSTRAIREVLPEKEVFDYTIRIVSEILESNGSSSMATVCAASLALMDGGVPIKSPVAGIAMGLMQEGAKVAVLSDILGDEDHHGDMDFKVAGTRDGITSVQMDIKIESLSRAVLEKALEQARQGRLHILSKMNEAISGTRAELSVHAPRVFTIKIHPDKIREVIGPGGKVIRAIQAETGTKVDIEDTGLVKVAAVIAADGERAVRMIKAITAEPEVGEIYEGTVTRTTDFGAFVQIIGNTEGLCHISQLDTQHVKKTTDVVKEGDKIRVKVLELTKDGKIRLSRRALLEEADGKGNPKNETPQRNPNPN